MVPSLYLAPCTQWENLCSVTWSLTSLLLLYSWKLTALIKWSPQTRSCLLLNHTHLDTLKSGSRRNWYSHSVGHAYRQSPQVIHIVLFQDSSGTRTQTALSPVVTQEVRGTGPRWSWSVSSTSRQGISGLGKGSEDQALTICLWSPQNMFGMWKPMVFLALAAVALYVLPNMRQQETEFCLMEWWQTWASQGGRSPVATTLSFGQDALCQSPRSTRMSHVSPSS